MRIPKCTRTVTGKHRWRTESWGMIELEMSGKAHFGKYKVTPFCDLCKMIDDRKEFK